MKTIKFYIPCVSKYVNLTEKEMSSQYFLITAAVTWHVRSLYLYLFISCCFFYLKNRVPGV